MNENVNRNVEKEGGGMLLAASEAFMANLPILICCLTVALTVLMEMFRQH